MTSAFTGGCACGAVRFETDRAPVFQNHCQCRDCQKRSGTGHASYLTFPGRAEMKVTGATSHWSMAGDSGNLKSYAFCPVCGTQVHLTFAAMPDFIAVPATSLDDPLRFEPRVLTYRLRALPWDRMDPALPAFDGMPAP